MTRLNWQACQPIIVLLILIGFTDFGLAQTAPQPKKPPSTSTATTPGQPAIPSPAATTASAPAASPNASAAGSVAVTGFRSALFGMSEAQVRDAIAKDFKVKSDSIKVEDNQIEQTRVLTAQVPDVLPGGGISNVSYVFGYKSKTLIQVGVTWSKATDDKMTPERLFSNANVLRSHFAGAGYKPDTMATNTPINGGLLMFRGNDAQDHSTLLILQGTLTQGENNQRVLTPATLLLFYIADAKSPDVFRLPPGSF